MVKTQENIEKKISKLLDDFQESEVSVVNQYNQEYQILKDTVVRMNQLDNDVVNLKARKELNTKNQFRTIIAMVIKIGQFNIGAQYKMAILGDYCHSHFRQLHWCVQLYK